MRYEKHDVRLKWGLLHFPCLERLGGIAPLFSCSFISLIPDVRNSDINGSSPLSQPPSKFGRTANGGEVRYVGEIANTPEAVEKLVRQLKTSDASLSFCYEAGGCGYGLHRRLTDLGWDCQVAAPSRHQRIMSPY
jgi:hypothetical protein